MALMLSAKPTHFIAAGINAGGPAGRAAGPGIASRPRGAPGAGSAGPRGSPETIAGNMQDTIEISGHDRLSCPIGGSGHAREHGKYRTGAGLGMRAVEWRLPVLRIDDLDMPGGPGAPGTRRCGFTAPNYLTIVSTVLGLT